MTPTGTVTGGCFGSGCSKDLSLASTYTGWTITQIGSGGATVWYELNGATRPILVMEATTDVNSDLNMPGMSGFELLPLVRLQFPIVRVIAMSGAFCGHQVPDGVTADAFYEKGNSLAGLLESIECLHNPNRQSSRAPEPLWAQKNGQDGMPAMPIHGLYPLEGKTSSIQPSPIPSEA